MANTYSQLNVHGVFSVKGRENFLLNEFRPRLFEYISGILKNTGQFPLAVNGYKDHIHIFFELETKKSVSDVLETIKANSSKWINEKKLIPGKFQWQKGFGAFSYSRSQRNDVIRYIMEQEEHHKRRFFREEYLELLDRFEVDYDPRYLFEFYD
jgi:putative transposase